MKVLPRLCISREFTMLAAGQTAPVATWLWALASHLHKELGGPGVGALGMCFTGGFALAMMVDAPVVAPVLAQPAAPFPIGARRSKADVGLSPAGTWRRCARAAAGCEVMGLRYTADRACRHPVRHPRARTRRTVVKVEFEGPGHSTPTEQRQQRGVDEVLAFFDRQPGERSPRDPMPVSPVIAFRDARRVARVAHRFAARPPRVWGATGEGGSGIRERDSRPPRGGGCAGWSESTRHAGIRRPTSRGSPRGIRAARHRRATSGSWPS